MTVLWEIAKGTGWATGTAIGLGTATGTGAGTAIPERRTFINNDIKYRYYFSSNHRILPPLSDKNFTEIQMSVWKPWQSLGAFTFQNVHDSTGNSKRDLVTKHISTSKGP